MLSIGLLVMAFLLGFSRRAINDRLVPGSVLFVYMLFNSSSPATCSRSTSAGCLGRPGPDVLCNTSYFPAAVFLGKVAGRELVFGLLIQFLWIVFFLIASRLAFHRGVRRYSGFGG